jgi:hypothetical protein
MNNISNFSSLVFAGILSKVITNPLERMKLIQQTRSVWETNALLRMNQKSVIELFKGNSWLTKRSEKLKDFLPFGEELALISGRLYPLVSSG